MDNFKGYSSANRARSIAITTIFMVCVCRYDLIAWVCNLPSWILFQKIYCKYFIKFQTRPVWKKRKIEAKVFKIALLKNWFSYRLFRMAATAANPIAEPPLFVNSLVLPKTFYKIIFIPKEPFICHPLQWYNYLLK